MLRRSNGFTLVEIAACVAVMTSMGGLSAVAWKHVAGSTRADRATAEVRAIESSLDAFAQKRGRPPADLNHDGKTTETEIFRQLKDWSFLADLSLDPSGRVIDPWGQHYVVVLHRDYGSRAADILLDRFDHPYNDQFRGFQVYSLCLADSLFTDDLARFSNINAHEAFPGVMDIPDPPTPPATPIDPKLAEKLIKEADKAADFADKYHEKADEYFETLEDGSSKSHCIVKKILKYSEKAADYAQKAADLAAEAVFYDPQYSDKADLYAQKAIDYADDADFFASMF